jgi:hypothetical protein
MKEIIKPISREVLKTELNKERFIRITNNGNNEIYIVDAHNSPNVMLEIGRLRELTFREAGGGTGEDTDIDHFDTDEICYKQLIVWSPEDEEIIGGYRFIRCGDAPKNEKGEVLLATAHLFSFSKNFIDHYLPYTIELGRSFVQPRYQPGIDLRKGLFSLDNIWDGLGTITIDNPDIKYFFGKVTMYLHYDKEARDMILYFLNHYFPDKENLIRPLNPLPYHYDTAHLKEMFNEVEFKDGFKLLNTSVRAKGENIPPLVNIYMNLSPTMKTFGTALNKTFGDVEETGIMVTINDIYEAKKERHLATYNPTKKRNY